MNESPDIAGKELSVTDSLVKDTLDEILRFNLMKQTSRQYKLLKYLLEKKKDGTIKSVSEFAIAVDVMSRNADFEPMNDSIVRTEMYRLRQSIKIFNSRSEKYALSLPRASYELSIFGKTKAQKKSLQKFLVVISPLIVAVFGALLTSQINGKSSDKFYADSTSECDPYHANVRLEAQGEIFRDELSKLELFIQQSMGANLISKQKACDNGTPVYLIKLDQESDTDFSLKLFDEAKNNILQTFEFKLSAEEQDPTLTFFHYLHSIVGPNSFMNRHIVDYPHWNSLARANVGCVIGMYDLWTLKNDNPNAHADTYQCMEDLIKSGNASATQYVLLRQAIRPLNKQLSLPAHWTSDYAEELMIEARKRDPESVLADYYDFRIWVQANPEKYEEMSARLQLLERKYQYNPDFLLQFSRVNGLFLGLWDKALEQDSIRGQINKANDNSVYVVKIGHSLLVEPDENSLNQCLKIFKDSVRYRFVIMELACAVRLGAEDEIKRVRDKFKEMGFETREDIIGLTKNSLYQGPVLINGILEIFQSLED